MFDDEVGALIVDNGAQNGQGAEDEAPRAVFPTTPLHSNNSNYAQVGADGVVKKIESYDTPPEGWRLCKADTVVGSLY